MSVPRVSVIMPVYNGANFIDKAMPSVLGQTLEAFELIIVNDCSKDNSLEILKAWAAKDSRISVHCNERNLGIFDTLNRLVALARCDLIKIFCQDDVLFPNCLERQVAYMVENPELAFSRCLGSQEIVESTRMGAVPQDRLLPEIIYPAASALAFFAFGNIPGNLTNNIFRKSMVIASGGFDQRFPYAGDFEVWSRIAEKYPFGLQQEVLLYVHSHDQQGSVTLNKHNELISQINEVVTRLYLRLPKRLSTLARWHGSVSYLVYQVGSTLRRFKERKWKAVALLFTQRDYAYPATVGILLYVLTFGRRWGHRYSTRRFLEEIHRVNRPVCGSVDCDGR